ncbi:hypothetical protein F5883DRAFT_674298 [Diaporthe sp. PMI_573]|nr:hypothetical protein F5883DRAFT_674298 [Diaporthaceae sp. PMI_573]
MLPTGNPIVMALVAAYCALAAPTSTQPDQVQEIINALKVQLETDNVTDASAMINEAEASLWASGALNDDVVANLKQQIQILTTEGGISVDAIAEHTIEYLNAKGAFKKSDQAGPANGAIFLDADAIKQVVDHGVNYNNCPDGSSAKLCGGCIPM